MTFVDGLLAVAVLLGLLLDTTLGWWWADPVAGYVIVYYAIREAIEIFRPEHGKQKPVIHRGGSRPKWAPPESGLAPISALFIR